MRGIHPVLPYALGLIWAANSPPLPLIYLIPLLILALLFWIWQRHGPFTRPLLGLLLMLAGLLLYPAARLPDSATDGVWNLTDDNRHKLEGVVVASAWRQPKGGTVDLGQLTGGSDNRSLAGRLRLYLGDDRPELVVGERIAFTTRLRQPQRFGVPGEFDYPRHLATEGIFATGWVKNSAALQRISPAKNNGSATLADWRQRQAERIAAALPEQESGLLQALLLGLRDRMSNPQRQMFAETGVIHLFAISGLHLGLLGLLLYSFALPLYRRSPRLLRWHPPARVLPWALLPLLWLYLEMTGAAVSTQRALLLAAIGFFLLIQRRHTAPLQALFSAALILLLVNPLLLFAPAFQLSCAGVAGLILSLPYANRLLPRRPGLARGTGRLIFATLGASLATATLVIFHFHLFAPAGLLHNLWAVPLIGWLVLPLGLFGLALSGWIPAAATLLWQVCGWLLHLAEGLLQGSLTLSSLRPLYLYPDPWQLTALFGLTLALLWPDSGRSHPWRIVLAGLSLVLVCVPYPFPKGLTLTGFSVGQGESLLLSSGGRHLLVDGGGLRSTNFDVGARLLAPGLGRLGVHRLDGILLTHAHPDHYLGLQHLLRHIPVQRFYSALPPEELPEGISAALQQGQVRAVQLQPGWQPLPVLPDASLVAYVPEQQTKQINDRSISLYAGLGSDGLLLTGDLQHEGIRKLCAEPPHGPCNLLKLPHHGSRHSAIPFLLHRFQFTTALVSAGRHNSYRLPHPQVVATLHKAGIELWRTDLQGTVQLTSKGNGWHGSAIGD